MEFVDLRVCKAPHYTHILYMIKYALIDRKKFIQRRYLQTKHEK